MACRLQSMQGCVDVDKRSRAYSWARECEILAKSRDIRRDVVESKVEEGCVGT